MRTFCAFCGSEVTTPARSCTCRTPSNLERVISIARANAAHRIASGQGGPLEVTRSEFVDAVEHVRAEVMA